MKGFGSTGPILFPPTEMARMPWGEQNRAGSSGTRHHSKVLAGVSGLLHGKPEVECTECSHNRVNAARPTRSHVRRTRQGAAGDGRRHSSNHPGRRRRSRAAGEQRRHLAQNAQNKGRQRKIERGQTKKDQQQRNNNAGKEPAERKRPQSSSSGI